MAGKRFISDVKSVGTGIGPASELAAGDAPVQIGFGAGTGVLLPKHPLYRQWREYLEARRRSGKKVYAEIAEEGDEIVAIHPVREQTVEQISDTGQKLDVMFGTAPSAHTLRKSHPDFARIRSTLERALAAESVVLVTNDPESLEIIEVEEPAADVALAAPPGPLAAVLTDQRCREEFASLAAQQHVPFAYALSCCHARAHEMRALLLARGIESRKIWLYRKDASESLRPEVLRFPNLAWRFHVAPLVTTVSGDKVLDPSLFNEPVTVNVWVARQRAPNAIQEIAPGEIFLRKQGDAPLAASIANLRFDNDRSETAESLENHRLDLAELQS